MLLLTVILQGTTHPRRSDHSAFPSFLQWLIILLDLVPGVFVGPRSRSRLVWAGELFESGLLARAYEVVLIASSTLQLFSSACVRVLATSICDSFCC